MGSHPVTSRSQAAPEPADVADRVSDTTAALAAARLVPDIVDGVADTARLEVRYGALSVENGRTLSPDDVAEEPAVAIAPLGPRAAAAGATYALLLVGADPAAPRLRCWLHWMAVNIVSFDVARGEEVVSYMPPEPAGRGPRRYAFLLFEQQGRLTLKKPKARGGFQVRAFAKEHALGDPAAALFFWSRADAEE